MSQKSKRKKLSKSKLLILILLIVGIGFGVWALFIKQPSSPPKSGDVATVSQPTADEKKAGELQKQQNVARENLDSGATPSAAKATPLITFVVQTANIEIGAVIGGIYEDGGICTAKLSQGADMVTQSRPASKGAQSTDCQNFAIPITDFKNKGSWQLVVSYKSANSEGSSQMKDITIK